MGMSGARIGKKICRACSPTQKSFFGILAPEFSLRAHG